MLRNPDYNPPGINNYVPAMQYDAAYHLGPICEFSLGVITPADPDGITAALNAQLPLPPVTIYRSSFVPGVGGDGAETKAKYGRCVSITPSGNPGASGYSVRVHGEDYIGQPMCETLAIASGGTTIITGNKAFKRITKLVALAQASNVITVNVGWADRLGLPYKVGQYAGGSEGAIDTGTGGIITESATGFVFDNAGTATIVSPVDGYCSGVSLELSAASTAGSTGIVATTLGAEYNLTVPILAVGQSVSNQVDPDAWVAVTRGQNLVWTSDGLGTGGTGTLIANFSEGGVPFVSSPDLTDPATLASKDPRGIYVPYSAPDGVKEYKVRYIPSSAVNAAGNGGLQGIAHFNQ